MAARVRKLGIAAVPTTASALLRRKMRRVIDMGATPEATRSYSQAQSIFKVARFQTNTRLVFQILQPSNLRYSSSPLKFRRADEQPCAHPDIRSAGWIIQLPLRDLRLLEAPGDCIMGLLRHVAREQRSLELGERGLRIGRRIRRRHQLCGVDGGPLDFS